MMSMCLRKRRSSPASDEPLSKYSTINSQNGSAENQHNSNSNANPNTLSNQGEEVEIFERTVFDDLIQDCMDNILDWLPLDSLCSFSRTCKSIQKIFKEYFARNCQSEELEVGDEFVFEPLHWRCFSDIIPSLCLYDSNLRDFAFAGSNANPRIRELSFDRTFKEENEITNEHIDKIKRLLENVKTVRALNCNFCGHSPKYLLDNCKTIEDFAFLVPKNYIANRIYFKEYPTLRNLEMHFHSKANVVEAIQSIREEKIHFLDLVLSFCQEHNNVMTAVFNELVSMHSDGSFKRLYLIFEKKSMVEEHINRITTMPGLEGLKCSYTINCRLDQHVTDICKLQNIKFLSVNWLLDNADQMAKDLVQLEEFQVSVISIDAIVSFVRYSSKLTKFHIETIRANKECNIKFGAFVLNRERMELDYARKIVIYIPEKKFIQLKWASVRMDSELIQIKREESCIPLKKDDTDIANDPTTSKDNSK